MADKLFEIAHVSNSAQVDAAGLAAALKRHLRAEVRFDDGSRALYATDGSNYRQVPIGVVVPRDVTDVISTVALAREFGAPILCRGAGTSLAGQCCNVAVVLDFSKYMSRILEIDPEERVARVEPGVILDDLRDAAEKYHLTFGPDPATHNHCTIGGMVGNNSCGVHSVMAGKTDDNIEALEILTYEGLRLQVGATSPEQVNSLAAQPGRTGEIYAKLRQLTERYADEIRKRFPDIPRRVSGFNLDRLLPEHGFHVARSLVGSEGTCVTVLEATCKLVNSPQFRTLVVLGYPDIFACGDAVPELMSHGPIGLEGIDDLLVEYTRRKGLHPEGVALLPEGKGWLLAEFGGATQAEADDRAKKMVDAVRGHSNATSVRIFGDKREATKVWEVRESSLGVISHVPGEPLTWEGWEDSAVPPAKLGAYLRDLRRLIEEYEYRGVLYGHFGHACIHSRISFDLQSEPGIRKFRGFMEDAADLVVRYGGSLSGEHGDGQARAELLPKMFGAELVQAFREFKAIWDPEWKMNPGKVVEPYRMDENLRLGADYDPWEPLTHFRFPDDEGSLSHATLRCVGVGKCRRYEGGLMCPSFRVTGEEEHSTRGRAHLLWEMTKRDVIRDGWQDEDVKRSLDLCLSCKGCKSDCPVGVDVATYKAEFLSHYHQTRPRSVGAYAFGNIDLLARLGSLAPGLANLGTQLPLVSDIAKAILGVPKERRLPPFAPRTFKSWFRERRKRKSSGSPVILWADTFNNYFHPNSAIAALDVLEAAGFEVLVPPGNLCCGRPLYDFGMLDRAKRLLLQILDTLALYIEAGVPVVVLEPSCAAVFRDELKSLFPRDERALRLSEHTFLLSEFLQKHASDFKLPNLHAKAVVHGHCHHKSIMKFTDEEAVLRKMGIEFEMPSDGCCGMAGSFGFEEGKYDVSLRIGELDLLPAIRKAAPESMIIADGFSCREQISQCTNRQALHLAEVIKLGFEGKLTLHAGESPESALVLAQERAVNSSMRLAGFGLAGLLAGAVALWAVAKGRH